MAKRRNRDPLAKRHDENDLQWRSRVARASHERRVASEPIVTAETLAKGDLEPAFVSDAETGTRAETYRRRSTSSLARLNARGVITDDQLAAAQEIAIIYERIGADVAVGSGSASERVDNDGGAGSYGGESYHRVCLNQAYSRWRLKLPLPRALVLDMVTEDHQLAIIAQRHHKGWRKAIAMLKDALDMWADMKREAFDSISEADVEWLNSKVG